MQANYATVTATDAAFSAADGRGWSVWVWGTTRRRHRLVVRPMVVVDAYHCLGFHGCGVLLHLEVGEGGVFNSYVKSHPVLPRNRYGLGNGGRVKNLRTSEFFPVQVRDSR